MMNRIAAFKGAVGKVEGPARSGKTEALVARCAALLSRGEDPERILVTCASSFACDRFREQLAARVPEHSDAAARIDVLRPLDVSLLLLDQPAARAATGRRPRILTTAEYTFFIEDLKTLGQRNQRLANMLMFFYKQWSDFKTEEDWLIRGEETTVLGRARDLLARYGGMLRHEAPYLCGKLLESPAGANLSQRWDWVLADDFQDYSLAEQAVVSRCAAKQLLACGNANETTTVGTEYPAPGGFARFARTRRGVEVFTLADTWGVPEALACDAGLRRAAGETGGVGAHAAAAAASGAGTARGLAGAGARFLAWRHPGAELEALPAIAAAFLAAHETARPCNVTVAVPTRQWGVMAARALERAGFAVTQAGLNPRLPGDPRAAGYHDAMSAFFLLNLVADQSDLMAWRAVCGFDDALTHSDAWEHLLAHADQTGQSALEALRALVEEGGFDQVSIAKQPAIAREWNAAWRAIERCRGLRGQALARAVGLTEHRVFDDALGRLSGNEDAAEVANLVRNQLISPHFSANPQAVRVVLFENMPGLDAQLLLVSGAVDGLAPARRALDPIELKDKRDQVLAHERQRFACAVTKSTQTLVACACTRSDLESAERLKMQVSRIFAAGGGRTAVVSPSLFFAEGGIGADRFEQEEHTDIAGMFAEEAQAASKAAIA